MEEKYLIKIEDKAKKQILKFDYKTRKRINIEIKKLEKIVFPKNPKHILATRKNSFLCELSFDNVRIYYKFSLKEIVIYKIKYEGKVQVFNIDKKKGIQQKYITKIKNLFKKGLCPKFNFSTLIFSFFLKDLIFLKFF